MTTSEEKAEKLANRIYDVINEDADGEKSQYKNGEILSALCTVAAIIIVEGNKDLATIMKTSDYCLTRLANTIANLAINKIGETIKDQSPPTILL